MYSFTKNIQKLKLSNVGYNINLKLLLIRFNVVQSQVIVTVMGVIEVRVHSRPVNSLLFQSIVSTKQHAKM